MSTHNICFHGEMRKNINTFFIEENILSGAMSELYKTHS